MKCENPYCLREHEGSYGSGRFCSSRCARAFSTASKRQEINEKVSKKLAGRRVGGRSFAKGFDPNRRIFTHEDRIKSVVTLRIRRAERYAQMDWNDLPLNERRRRILYEQNGKCLCGINEWNGSPLTLELHHIDGNNGNNVRNNLCFLCPNCHSQTPNYRSQRK
jgi:hypothetical protein